MNWRALLWPRKANVLPAARDSQEQMERWVVEGFRTVGRLCTQLANYVEAQRLSRGGYPPQERFLDRTDLPVVQRDPAPGPRR